MRYFLHLGYAKSLPKHGLLQVMHSQKPHLLGVNSKATSGEGYAGVQKKNIGSMSGTGRKIAPLRFKM